MKSWAKIGLGILTSIGGFLEAGSLATALQAGARFGWRLLWPLVLGTLCVACLVEMSGRLAAVSKMTLVEATRRRFGLTFQRRAMIAQGLVDLLVLATEIAGAALALSLATNRPMPMLAIAIAFGLWLLLWFGTFGTIENGAAALGLVTVWFVWAAWHVRGDWHPHQVFSADQHTSATHYWYLAVSILGATISPYMVTFYSSGAIEEKWNADDLMPNRVVAFLGMAFGCVVAAAVLVVSATVLGPLKTDVDHFPSIAAGLGAGFGVWGFRLFWMSLFVGCAGAALEVSLDLSYLVAQTSGWKWGENIKSADDRRFALVYTIGLIVATIPSVLSVDPMAITLVTMSSTVLVLPLVAVPLLVIMNDRRFLKDQPNRLLGNLAVTVIVVLGAVLALVAIPLQIWGS